MLKAIRTKRWISPVGIMIGAVMINLAAADGYLSPETVVATRDGRTIYIAQAGVNRIAVFDVATDSVAQVIALPEPNFPSGLALSPDGTRLYVTKAQPLGEVQIVNTPNHTVVDTIPVGHTPLAPVVSPDGGKLYVCNRFDNTVSVKTIATKQKVVIPVAREPVAAALTPNGKFLFIAHLLFTGAATGQNVAAEVSVIDTATDTVVSFIQLPNGSAALRGICVSPDGQYAYVTHIISRYHLPPIQIERGWIQTSALSVINVSSKSLVDTVLLDDLDLGAANPWGVACSADGKTLCVTHSGTHEVSVIDRAGLHIKLAKATDVSRDLAFLVGLRRRLPLAGNGPRGLALIGHKAYAAEYFTGSLGVVDIDPDNAWPQAISRPLGVEPALTDVRKGERLFHDAQFCLQKWQSCTSCHIDSRSSGFNWAFSIGKPHNQKSALLSHQTPPATITGDMPDAETIVRKSFPGDWFTLRPESDGIAIDEYLKSLRPVPSPYLVNGQLSATALRGKTLFEGAAGCADCHPSSTYFTDMGLHDVGTGMGHEIDKAFDTPTLVEVWRTAPYLCQGQAATMEDVLTIYNPNDRHGTTTGLSSDQILELAEYVLSIGLVP